MLILEVNTEMFDELKFTTQFETSEPFDIAYIKRLIDQDQRQGELELEDDCN